MITSTPQLLIGHVSEGNFVIFDSNKDARTAWMMLAAMKVPAAINSGMDGWLPNTGSTGWGRECLFPNWSLLPDLSVVATQAGFQVTSAAMQCECAAKKEKVWRLVAELINEYRDRAESGCWDVAR